MEKFTKNEMNKFRPTLAAYKELFGKVIVCPMCDNLDLKHNDKAKDNVNPRLANPIKKYFTKSVEIVKIELTKTADDRPAVIFNDDSDLIFPITSGEKPKVLECTPDRITEAIRNYRESKQITFFCDIDAVNKQIMSLNNNTIKDLEKFAEELLSFTSTLRDVNKQENTVAQEYLDSLKNID